nr:MAG TPA: tail protein [Bacteriophage sp.]
MKLSTLEFARLLPAFMRGDLSVQGLAHGIDDIIPAIAASVQRLTTWDKIDELSESELDALAWELNIMWYDKTASIEAKRELVLNSDKVYRRLGTKWAVENVIQTYFGDGYIKEWFEYNGTPGYFRVYSTNPTLNNERLTEFLNILNKVKRHSSKLDGIYITLTGEMKIAAGVGVRETAKETYKIGATLT